MTWWMELVSHDPQTYANPHATANIPTLAPVCLAPK